MLWVGKDLEDHVVPAPHHHGQGHLPLDRLFCSQFLTSLFRLHGAIPTGIHMFQFFGKSLTTFLKNIYLQETKKANL